LIPDKRKGANRRFLVGWKQIGDYLGISARTAQRYENKMGLPVRRPLGRSRSAVLASQSEIDAWVQAMPLSKEFPLARVSAQTHPPVSSGVHASVKEMYRLCSQMMNLRAELVASHRELQESIAGIRVALNCSVPNVLLKSSSEQQPRPFRKQILLLGRVATS